MMSPPLTETELETIWAAAAALPPPQRAAFQEMVTSHLRSLPCTEVGPGSLHRIIAECQRAILKSGVIAVGPSPKRGKRNAVEGRARAKQARQA